MGNKPIEMDPLTERVLYSIIQSFDLSYDDERVRSILFDGMHRLANEKVAEEEDAEVVASVITEGVASLIRAHLDRTVHMSVLLLLFVANKIAIASIRERGLLQVNDIRNYLPSEDQVMKQAIKPLFSQWLQDFDVPLRSSGRLPKKITENQFDKERTEWLQKARTKYARLKDKHKGNLGIALGYGRGKDGEQNNAAAGKTLKRKMDRYGYEWEDVISKK